MKKNLLRASLVATLISTASAATNAATQSAAPQAASPITYRTTHYVCDGKQAVSVKSITVGQSDFVVVNYKGKEYALAPAVSASGLRYVGLAGLTMNTGLEWVQWQGKGFLSSFPVQKPEATTTVLDNCRVAR